MATPRPFKDDDPHNNPTPTNPSCSTRTSAATNPVTKDKEQETTTLAPLSSSSRKSTTVASNRMLKPHSPSSSIATAASTNVATNSSISELVPPPHAALAATPLLLPHLPQIMPSASQPTRRNEEQLDTDATTGLFDWQLPSSLTSAAQGTARIQPLHHQVRAQQQEQSFAKKETSRSKPSSSLAGGEPTTVTTQSKAAEQQQQQQQPSQQPLDEAVSLLLAKPRRTPSVRFATHDEIRYYEAAPVLQSGAGNNDDDDDDTTTEEGFQMDHVFDDLATVTATPPLSPPRRRPSLETVTSFDYNAAGLVIPTTQEDGNPQQQQPQLQDDNVDDALVRIRAGMPRHNSVESETTLSISSHDGECGSSSCTLDDEAEDLLLHASHFSLQYNDAQDNTTTAAGTSSPIIMDDTEDSIIRQVMESLLVEATTTSDQAAALDEKTSVLESNDKT